MELEIRIMESILSGVKRFEKRFKEVLKMLGNKGRVPNRGSKDFEAIQIKGAIAKGVNGML